MLQEVLPRAGPEVEKVRPDACRSGLARRPDDLAELLRPVRDPRQDRRHADTDLDPRVDELVEGTEALARMRRARLRLAPHVLVERRDRERDRDLRALPPAGRGRSRPRSPRTRSPMTAGPAPAEARPRY